MPYQALAGATIANDVVTTVDCQKQVRSWRLLRSLMELLIPSCNCTTLIEEHEELTTKGNNKSTNPYYYHDHHHHRHPSKANIGSISSSATITGTIFGFRRGKANFCIQTNSKSNPILLLELAVPTTILAREMQGGVLRIALESFSHGYGNSYTTTNAAASSLLSMPVWTMYCNGRKVGYAVKRKPSKREMDALRLMSSVVVGAGIISGKELDHEDDGLIYLRANFERVSGSSEAESFHLIDPDGSIGQELSIFFFRPR